MTLIYLDNAATTQIDPEVISLITKVMADGPLNASSLHSCGRIARNYLELATDQIGRCLNSKMDEPGGARLVFTGSGTEANNLVIRGMCKKNQLIVSRIEHPSVIGVGQWLERTGKKVHWLEVDSIGRVSTEHLESLLQSDTNLTSLVSIMWANNETGVLQPIDRISELCRKYNAKLHVDATQCVGKIPIDLEKISLTSMSFTGHKFHGPAGVGGVWLSGGETLDPIMYGGEQQLETRPGTEPVALIAGMAFALEIACERIPETLVHCSNLRDRLENRLKEMFPDIVIQGSKTSRLPGTSCISFLGADRQSMLMALDFEGVSCSSGSACSSGSSPPSHVLRAMRRSKSEINSAIRFAVSRFSTLSEIESAVEKISKVYRRLKR